MKVRLFATLFVVFVMLAGVGVQAGFAASPKYDINTLAGKVASLNGTAGLQIRFSAFIEEEANIEEPNMAPSAPITPSFVLSSPLDGNTVTGSAVTVNQDTAGAPQNELSRLDRATAYPDNRLLNRPNGGCQEMKMITTSCAHCANVRGNF